MFVQKKYELLKKNLIIHIFNNLRKQHINLFINKLHDIIRQNFVNCLLLPVTHVLHKTDIHLSLHQNIEQHVYKKFLFHTFPVHTCHSAGV